MFKKILAILILSGTLVGLITKFQPFGKGAFVYFDLLANVAVVGVAGVFILLILLNHLYYWWRAKNGTGAAW